MSPQEGDGTCCIESQNLENRINHEKDLLRDPRRKIRRRIPACRKPPQNIGPSWSMQVAVAIEDTPMGSLMEWTMTDMSMDKSTQEKTRIMVVHTFRPCYTA